MNGLKKRVFLDFDHTLYDTDAMMDVVQRDMCAHGAKMEDVEHVRKRLSREGYSFERHLELLGFPPDEVIQRVDRYRALLADGDRFLFPGIVDGMARLNKVAECQLLTFGNPAYQMRKVDGVHALERGFAVRRYVWTEKTKGEVIREYADGMETFVLDDSPAQLEDVRANAPFVTCVRMMWPLPRTVSHPGDGVSWIAVETFDAFVSLVCGGAR